MITTACLHVCGENQSSYLQKTFNSEQKTVNSEQTACGHNSNNEVIHFIAACPCNRVNYFTIMYSTTAQKHNAPYKRKLSHYTYHYRDNHKNSYEKPKKTSRLLLTFWQPAALTIPNE